MDALTSFVDPGTGKHPIARAFRREDVFSGRHLETAPDVVLEATPLYSLTHASSVVEDADWLSGDHRMEGVIAAAGPGVGPDAFVEPRQLLDVAPTVLAALGVPPSVKHDGQVLASIVGEEVSGTVPSRVGADLGAPTESGLDAEEAREVEEHLRGLGYLE
jgi:predicted AlkP superfamily phosphohydrolase/phosphomutase